MLIYKELKTCLPWCLVKLADEEHTIGSRHRDAVAGEFLRDVSLQNIQSAMKIMTAARISRVHMKRYGNNSSLDCDRPILVVVLSGVGLL